jgi:hypothetical protein
MSSKIWSFPTLLQFWYSLPFFLLSSPPLSFSSSIYLSPLSFSISSSYLSPPIFHLSPPPIFHLSPPPIFLLLLSFSSSYLSPPPIFLLLSFSSSIFVLCLTFVFRNIESRHHYSYERATELRVAFQAHSKSQRLLPRVRCLFWHRIFQVPQTHLLFYW